MTSNSRKLLSTLVAAAAIGAAPAAMAAPAFTIDLAAILGGASDQYSGDFFSGTSTELLKTIGNTHEGSGWMQISGLTSNASTVIGFGTASGKYGDPFNMYVTFTLKDVLASGTMNAGGSTYNLTELNFQLWADPNKDTTLTNASVTGGVASAATVGGTTSNDYILGFGKLISGTAVLKTDGGAALNSTNFFGLCTGAGTGTIGSQSVAFAGCTNGIGSNFFVSPKPFYEIAFTEFNNTSQGYSLANNGDLVINSASGGVDFNRVPEPASLALLGLGLLGLGASRRRKN